MLHLFAELTAQVGFGGVCFLAVFFKLWFWGVFFLHLTCGFRGFWVGFFRLKFLLQFCFMLILH